jgi:hypothetical protein
MHYIQQKKYFLRFEKLILIIITIFKKYIMQKI